MIMSRAFSPPFIPKSRALAGRRVVNSGQVRQLRRVRPDLPAGMRGVPHGSQVDRTGLHVAGRRRGQRRCAAARLLGEFRE